MILFDRLIDDARLTAVGPDGSRPSGHLPASSPDHGFAPAGLMGRLVVADRDLTRIAELTPAESVVEVSVLNTSGAGGLLTLARRRSTRLVVGAAESTLRDLDDLAGNAARVVTAAQQLDQEIELFVGLPPVLGWVRAVEVVEAAGCYAKVNLAEVDPTVGTAQLSVLIEADLAFKVSGLPADRLLPLLVTVSALIDGLGAAEAARLLVGEIEPAARLVETWDEATQARVRRRLRSCDSGDPAATVFQLVRTGLVG